MTTSSLNPFLGLNKANKLIKQVIGIPVIQGRLLDDLQIISRMLDYICTYQVCLEKSYAESPFINKEFDAIELFEENGDSINDLF